MSDGINDAGKGYEGVVSTMPVSGESQIPHVYEGDSYASVKLPERCPQCDGREFISHGSKGMVCHICWLNYQLAQAEASNQSQIPKTRKIDTPLLDRDEAWKRLIDRCAALEASNQSLQDENLSLKRTINSIAGGSAQGMLLHYKQEKITALESSLRDIERKLAVIFDDVIYSDSYGVPGSSFSVCRWCAGGSGPGGNPGFRHNPNCLFEDGALESKIEEHWDRTTVRLEKDIEALQQQLREAVEALEGLYKFFRTEDVNRHVTNRARAVIESYRKMHG
jgi:prefoldin subunit 5